MGDKNLWWFWDLTGILCDTLNNLHKVDPAAQIENCKTLFACTEKRKTMNIREKVKMANKKKLLLFQLHWEICKDTHCWCCCCYLNTNDLKSICLSCHILSLETIFGRRKKVISQSVIAAYRKVPYNGFIMGLETTWSSFCLIQFLSQAFISNLRLLWWCVVEMDVYSL